MNYDSPREIATFLNDRGLSLKKRFGQNFLVSPGARERIISTLDPRPEDTLWEIGGGIGAMSHMLTSMVRRLIVFEIDHGLTRALKESIGAPDRFELIEGDYLKRWQEAHRLFGAPNRILGNLPYNVASQIIASLVNWERPVGRAVFTVQREVAHRMAARPGTKDYSGFSLICQSVFEVGLHGDIAARSFYPVPEVVSTVVSLTPRMPLVEFDRELYGAVVRDLFAARRKTIRNNLSAGSVARRFGQPAVDDALRRAGISPGDRGEMLSVEEVQGLVEALRSSDRAD